MLRAFIYALLAIIAITMLRMVIGILARGFSDLINPPATPKTADANGGRPRQSAGGKLKRDPVCGAYVPAGTSLTKVVEGETFHFCSATCRDKYAA